MNNLTATVITLNEEHNLPQCLESLKNLAGEVIVVDCGSQDKTVEIAKRFGAKVFHRKFDNFANQKNWAADKATKDWILSVDADEIITKKLADEIKKAIHTDKFLGYLIPRRNFILGAEIKYSRWSPDEHIWLWKKGQGKWLGDVHEEVVVDGKVGRLQEAKIHYQDKTIAEFMATNDRYSSLKAKQMLQQGMKFSIFKMIRDSLFEFSVRFIYKKGFLDGLKGLVLAYLMAVYKLNVWLKLRRLEAEQK